eukprot:8713110-Prorocentrum_lima.AAC.1
MMSSTSFAGTLGKKAAVEAPLQLLVEHAVATPLHGLLYGSSSPLCQKPVCFFSPEWRTYTIMSLAVAVAGTTYPR